MTGWRVDYAAVDHPAWLSLMTSTFPEPMMAVQEAQLRLERWEPCIGFRIVPAAMAPFQKMTEDHLGKIVDLSGKKIIP